MQKFRKGFTLVELLVVIAILGTLSAIMSVSVSGSTGKAKAATIAANVRTFRAIAALYMAENAGEDLSSKTAESLMKEKLPAWADLANADANAKVIKYKATGDTGPDSWKIEIDFGSDPEKATIQTALASTRGFGKYYKDANTAETIFSDNVYKFTVELATGKIAPVTAATGT